MASEGTSPAHSIASMVNSKAMEYVQNGVIPELEPMDSDLVADTPAEAKIKAEENMQKVLVVVACIYRDGELPPMFRPKSTSFQSLDMLLESMPQTLLTAGPKTIQEVTGLRLHAWLTNVQLLAKGIIGWRTFVQRLDDVECDIVAKDDTLVPWTHPLHHVLTGAEVQPVPHSDTRESVVHKVIRGSDDNTWTNKRWKPQNSVERTCHLCHDVGHEWKQCDFGPNKFKKSKTQEPGKLSFNPRGGRGGGGGRGGACCSH